MPGQIATVSPFAAASIAFWIFVYWAAGHWALSSSTESVAPEAAYAPMSAAVIAKSIANDQRPINSNLLYGFA